MFYNLVKREPLLHLDKTTVNPEIFSPQLKITLAAFYFDVVAIKLKVIMELVYWFKLNKAIAAAHAFGTLRLDMFMEADEIHLMDGSLSLHVGLNGFLS